MLLILLLLLRCGGAQGGGGAHDGALGGSHHCPCAKHPYQYLDYPGGGQYPNFIKVILHIHFISTGRVFVLCIQQNI